MLLFNNLSRNVRWLLLLNLCMAPAWAQSVPVVSRPGEDCVKCTGTQAGLPAVAADTAGIKKIAAEVPMSAAEKSARNALFAQIFQKFQGDKDYYGIKRLMYVLYEMGRYHDQRIVRDDELKALVQSVMGEDLKNSPLIADAVAKIDRFELVRSTDKDGKAVVSAQIFSKNGKEISIHQAADDEMPEMSLSMKNGSRLTIAQPDHADAISFINTDNGKLIGLAEKLHIPGLRETIDERDYVLSGEPNAEMKELGRKKVEGARRKIFQRLATEETDTTLPVLKMDMAGVSIAVEDIAKGALKGSADPQSVIVFPDTKLDAAAFWMNSNEHPAFMKTSFGGKVRIPLGRFKLPISPTVHSDFVTPI